MIERLTEEGRQVLVNAQSEARTLGQPYIGTEHLLLGLLGRPTPAAAVLERLGVDQEEARAWVARVSGSADVPVQIPFTPRAKKVLELSLREALSWGQNYIYSEHILLALVRENEGVAARYLLELEVEPEAVRAQVGEALRERRA